jgi:hypothetical protein
MSQKIKHLLAIFTLPFIAAIAYWQVAFNKYILTHDFINCWMPWRYYLSHCIQNKIFPFWNPYQQLGYPIHADLQGPAWYLESWLFSMLTEQNPINLQYLFVGYIALAGIGMYGLSYYLQGSKKVAWCIGVTYMLSGFFVAHSQHFYSIISAAWLPFIVLNFLRLVQLKQLKYGLYTSLFLFLTLTGGNHTFAFFTLYLLLIISVYYLYVNYKNGIPAFLSLFKQLLITLLLTIAQVVMVILAFIQVQPFISRLSGLDYNSCISNSFTWQALVSFFQPFATTVNWEYYQTDPSMSNHYFGLLLLPFCVLFIWKSKSALEKLLAFFAIFCLAISFGDVMPFYKLMYNYLPGVNLFRFISYFAFMFTFCMLLLVGNTLSILMVQFEQRRKLIATVFIITFGIIFLIAIYAISKGNFIEFVKFYFNNQLFERNNFGSRYDHIAFQAIIQLLLFLTLSVAFLKKSRWLFHTFMFAIVIDLVIAVQLNIGNVCIGNSSPVELTNYTNTLPKDFPCPADEPLMNYNEERGQKFGLYRNTGIFHKWISDSYHNSFVFTGKTFLHFEKPEFYEAMLQNRLFYLSNALYPKKDLDKYLKSENLNLKVFMESDVIDILSKRIAISDSLVQGALKLKDVKPNQMEAIVTCNSNSMLHCIQSYYTGWKAFIDNKETPIYRSNGLTMSIVIPKGTHKISFKYSNPLMLTAGIFSYGVFLILLICITYMNRNHSVYRYMFIALWTLSLIIVLKYLLFT